MTDFLQMFFPSSHIGRLLPLNSVFQEIRCVLELFRAVHCSLSKSGFLMLHCTFYEFCSFFKWPECSKCWRDWFSSWNSNAWNSRLKALTLWLCGLSKVFTSVMCFCGLRKYLQLPLLTSCLRILNFISKLLCYHT